MIVKYSELLYLCGFIENRSLAYSLKNRIEMKSKLFCHSKIILSKCEIAAIRQAIQIIPIIEYNKINKKNLKLFYKIINLTSNALELEMELKD